MQSASVALFERPHRPVVGLISSGAINAKNTSGAPVSQAVCSFPNATFFMPATVSFLLVPAFLFPRAGFQ
jgi:hypothetical protein